MGTVQDVVDKFNLADNEIKATFPKVDPRLVAALVFDHNAKRENIYTLEIMLKPGQDTGKIREMVMYKSGVAPGFYLNGTKMVLSHPLNLEFLKWINDQDGIVDVKGAPYSAGGATNF